MAKRTQPDYSLHDARQWGELVSGGQLSRLTGEMKERVVAAVLLDEANPDTPVATLGARVDIDRLTANEIPSSALMELDLRDATDSPVTLRILLGDAAKSTPNPNDTHVLVIDDEQQNRSYYEEVLTSGGYNVQLAATGDDGFRAALQHPPALILLDIRLPDTNGYELARLIRSQAQLDDVPVLLMSTDPDLAVESRITSAGAAGFLVAPTSPDQLLAIVKSTVRPVQRNVAEPPSDEPASEADRQVRISLFGPPKITDHRGSYNVPHGRSSELFATLAISAPEPVTTERLAQLAWPEGKSATPGAVYTAMSRLRTSLQNAGFESLVDSDLSGYRLTIEPSNIDVLQFDRVAAQAMADQTPTAEELRSILALWLGDPFQGRVSNDLTVRFTVRLQETRARLLEQVAVDQLLRAVPSEAALALTDLLVDEPWRESAWALLITALYRAGRQRDALSAFQEARSRMARELGVDPGPLLRSCETKILNHDPELLTDAWLHSLSA